MNKIKELISRKLKEFSLKGLVKCLFEGIIVFAIYKTLEMALFFIIDEGFMLFESVVFLLFFVVGIVFCSLIKQLAKYAKLLKEYMELQNKMNKNQSKINEGQDGIDKKLQEAIILVAEKVNRIK
ncbi:MAG: hypothetical protein GY679_01675 [Mycoplasma sp.]|nr:hypothetical protein [Mycoplasma sp.]